MKVTEGITSRPYKIVIYGQEGVGKTTWASAAPDPVALCAERGADLLGIPRVDLESYDHLIATIKEAGTSKYQSVFLDTIDAIEPMIWEHVCKKAGVPSMESFQFGKGHAAAYECWLTLRALLDRPGVKHHTIILAHSRSVKTLNPNGSDWFRHSLKLAKDNVSKSDPSEIWKEWADVVGFAFHDSTLTPGKKGETVKALSLGDNSGRRLGLAYSPSYDAKCRLPLPASMKFDGAEFWRLVREIPKNRDEVLDRIRTLVEPEALERFETFALSASFAEAMRALVLKLDKVR